MGEGGFRRIAVALIDVAADRARAADPAKAAAIGATMKTVRQFDPITVTPADGGRYLLVDGLHRLTGAQMEGIDELDARVVELTPAEQKKQEILSNLVRADMDALSRARSITALCDILKAQDGRRKRGRPSKKDIENQADEISALGRTNFGWTEEAAAALGLQRRPIFEYLRIGRRISPDLQLANTPIAQNLKALLKLSDLEEGEQVEVARAYNTGAFKTVDEARLKVAGAILPAGAKNAADVAFDRAAAAFLRLSPQEKLRFVGEIIARDKRMAASLKAALDA